MNAFEKICLILALPFCCACSREVYFGAPEPDPEQESGVFLSGTVNVKFKEAASAESDRISEVLSEIGATSFRRLFPDDGEFDERHHKEGLDRWYRVSFPEEYPSTKAVSAMSSLEEVDVVEVPRKRRLTSVKLPFNDPDALKWQWNYYNDGTLARNFCKGADIDVVPVWNQYSCGSSDVIVAVVDGGIDMSHPDLSSVTIAAGSQGSKNFCVDSRGRYLGVYEIYPYDHGTHVAGIIGAVNNNGMYVCGIAGGRDGKGGVRLLSCQVFMYDASTTTKEEPDEYYGDTAEAIVWACDKGAHICNCSWGYVYDTERDASKGVIDRSDREAVDYFVKYAGCDNSGNQLPGSPMKGGLVVFAAGNEGWRYGAPADYEKVLAVGAFGPDGNVTSYSNYGTWVDLCAPGGDYESFRLAGSLWSTSPMDDRYVWTWGGYDGIVTSMDGTSMACPHVSGVAALLVSYFGGRGFTADDLKKRLVEGADKDWFKSPKAGVKLDALGSFVYSDNRPPVKNGELDNAVIDSVDGELRVDLAKVFSDPEGDPIAYTVTLSNDNISDYTFDGNHLVLMSGAYGKTKVTVGAGDRRGVSCSSSFEVVIRDGSYEYDLYPIPVSVFLNVRYGSMGEKEFHFELFNPLGKSVFEAYMTGDVFTPSTVNMGGCAPGVYSVRITDEDGKVFDYPVVKK